MSVMEMSHRGADFMGIAAAAEADLRALLKIPDNYKVLFMQGGATTQFAGVPLNLTKDDDTIDHVVTGTWSKKAAAESEKFCHVNVAAKARSPAGAAVAVLVLAAMRQRPSPCIQIVA
jgi:phosphoserine aminotransferase